MTIVFDEDLNGAGLAVGIVVARFNTVVTERLLAGALEGLRERGADLDACRVVWVPAPSRCRSSPVAWRSPADTPP